MITGIIARLFVYIIFGMLIFSILKISLNIFKYQNSLKQGDIDSLKKLETRQEPLNLIGMILVLLFIFILINIKVGFEFDGTEGDLPGKILALIPAIFSLLILINSIFQKLRGKKKVRRYGLINEIAHTANAQELKIDLKRKFYHIFVFCLIFGFLLSSNLILQSNANKVPDSDLHQDLLSSFWGFEDPLFFIKIIFIRQSLPLGQTITFLFMYGAMIVLLFNDLTRLSQNLQFIMHKESQKIMRYKELDTLASYTHFAVAYLFSSIILPPMLFLAALCLGSFADPAASIFGLKFGKIKYKWNSKSLEGTLAGFFFAIISMFWFVGPIYAVVGALCFVIVDLFTPKPIQLSDNLLLPIIITIAYIILALCGIPPINYIPL
ncbi:MAG: hypothetical protein K9W44_12665 [Candidatus Lokiarchaeota archaeon]|nr:hypothetical protein [Candidatus Harpocratesius repetitus]